MSRPNEIGAGSLLRAATPAAWLARAARERDILLIDHASCEKKAASTALALMFTYAENLPLADRLSRLAREELRHYEQVSKLMRTLGVVPVRLAPSRYAEGLRSAVRRHEPGREVDLMIIGALIEARSCERFERLADAIDEPLKSFYRSLHAAEARHASLYWGYAQQAGAQSGIDAGARAAELASIEGELITSPDPQFRFHSGRPE
jgi:tRNA 2-(methylsulfanyl)-N6-isopentenyladenosine37 hydroxylase